jgi:hypothetical protein
MRWITAFALALSCALLTTNPGTALAKTKSDITFRFPADRPIKIILFRPDVEVGSLGSSGVPTPNADWTGEARKMIGDALKANQNAKSSQLIDMAELSGDDAAYVAEYQSLFKAVGQSMILHSYALKLPTKKMPNGKYRFDWTLGPGAQKLGTLGGGNYGLFVYSYDAYATAGRKAMQIFTLIASSALGFGVFPTGGQHVAYAALVDLDSGNIVWFNAYAKNKGDVRTPEGATERANTLLSTLPLREGEVAQKKTAARR